MIDLFVGFQLVIGFQVLSCFWELIDMSFVVRAYEQGVCCVVCFNALIGCYCLLSRLFTKCTKHIQYMYRTKA